MQALLLSKVCCVQTWGNRADALVRQAELLAEVTPAQSGDDAVGQAFAQAMQAYEKACSMTSSEQGDDLPGLLHNWGVGLRSMADLQKVSSCHRHEVAGPFSKPNNQDAFARLHSVCIVSDDHHEHHRLKHCILLNTSLRQGWWHCMSPGMRSMYVRVCKHMPSAELRQAMCNAGC